MLTVSSYLAAGRSTYKTERHIANHTAVVTWLANNFLTYDCELSNAIVAEWYGSEDEMS